MRTPSLLVLLTLGAVVACSGADRPSTEPAGPLSQAFATSALANHVPRDLMVAIAQTEGGLAMPKAREVEVDAAVQVAGPMQLRHGRFDSLARGAALMGTTELALRSEADLGLEAGARVLADVGARLGAQGEDFASWGDAIEEMSGYADDAHRREYAHRVFALLARGGTFQGRDGEAVTLAPHDLPPTLTLDLSTTLKIQTGQAEYGPAQWFPTSCVNKCNTDRGGNSVTMIAIHDTEGGWDASVATLQNDPGKSVHYIVGTDGAVGQFIPESYTGWHVGNYYYNQRMVGIEHVGYANQPYPEAEYDASAALVKYLMAKYNVPADRTHIIGHDQVPDGNTMAESSPPCESSPATCETGTSYGGASNHRDPGDWEWALYMVKIGGQGKCNDIWNLWNCSSDKTQAFRCTNNVIQIESCDGPGQCVSQPLGQDDVCNKAPLGSDAGVADTGTKSDGAAPVGDAGTPPPPPPQPGQGGPPPKNPGAQDAPAPTGSSGGCTMAPPSSGEPSGGLFAMALCLAGVAIAKRRRAA